MSLEDVIGVPISEQISSVLGLGMNARELEVITQVNAGSIHNLMKHSGNTENNKKSGMVVENIERFSMAYNRLSYDGKFTGQKKECGLMISEKIKYILESRMDIDELVNRLDINKQTVTKHRGDCNINGIQFRIAIKYEKLFNELCRNGDLNLTKETSFTVSNHINNVTHNELIENIYKDLRTYRYGSYLIFDEYDFYKNHELKEKINVHLKNKDNNFRIIKKDTSISFHYDLKFVFNVSVEYGEKSNYKIVLSAIEIPKKLMN